MTSGDGRVRQAPAAGGWRTSAMRRFGGGAGKLRGMSETTTPTAASATADPATAATRDVPALAREHAGRGKVTEARGDLVVFKPRGTSYEMHLAAGGLTSGNSPRAGAGDPYEGPVGKPVDGVVHVRARKVYTVPSGGNFVVPIMGEPRIVQGRIVALGEGGRQVIVHAGARVLVELPRTSDAIDLHSGQFEVGGMINVVCHPGAAYLPVA